MPCVFLGFRSLSRKIAVHLDQVFALLSSVLEFCYCRSFGNFIFSDTIPPFGNVRPWERR